MTFLFSRRLLLIVALISLVAVNLPTVASAGWLKEIGIDDDQIIPEDCTGASAGNVNSASESETANDNACNLKDVFRLIINVTTLIFALTGTAALLMFTYGGVIFIIAGGNTERVSKAKEILKMATIGIIIILGAWLVVNTVILALSGGEFGGTATVFSKAFNLAPSGK